MLEAFLRFYMFAVGLMAFSLKAEDVCLDWFSTSKIKPGPNCLSECAIYPKGMDTFNCSLRCEKFCAASPSGKTISEYTISSILEIYPSLTSAERAFAAKNPKQAMRAYAISWRAEKKCKKLFPVSDTNDESDACRHFMWAGLLANEFGADTAKIILDAHEDEPDQPEREKAMDLANNREALLKVQSYIANKTFNEDEFLNVFIGELNSKKLIVLRRKIPDWKDIK